MKMIVIGGVLIGAIWGGLLAKRKGGKPADIAQYAAAFAILLGIIGLFITIIVERLVF